MEGRGMAKATTGDVERVGVNFTLDTALLRRLDAVAERARMTRSELLRRVVAEALEREDAEEADWAFSDRRSLLADYGPEDEGLYDNPEALGATPVER
jgi:hypothetical protein